MTPSRLILLSTTFTLLNLAQAYAGGAQLSQIGSSGNASQATQKLQERRLRSEIYEKNSEGKLFVSAKATEAVMTFEHFTLLDSDTKPSREEALEQIEAQLVHLFGPMGEAEISAVPKTDHKIKILKIEEQGQAGTWQISYSYKGTLLVSNKAGKTYDITLPKDPTKIYKAGVSGSHKPCTDEHYDSEGDFWYFWNPSNPGCPLQEGRDFDVVKAKLSRLPNTTESYPEYERLIRKDSDGNQIIRISVLMGMDDPENGKDPLKSADVNAENYRDLRSQLTRSRLGLGFESRKLTNEEIKEIVTKSRVRSADLGSVEEFTKTYPSPTEEGKTITLKILAFFGESGIDQKSTAFHYMFKDALENSSVMIYDGHSGLGGHLDLLSIEEAEGFKIKIPKNEYQIYFFNSCSSYTYYNSMYFERKKKNASDEGTKNLDILNNGLATYFSVMQDTNMSVIKAIDSWLEGKNVFPYQTIAKDIDSNNLFAVNGDEDNPPRK